MKTSFLSSEGRIGRVTFLTRILLLTFFAAALSYIIYHYFAHQFHHGEFVTLGIFCSIVIAIITKLACLMQLLKRLRDMGREAYFVLLMLLPGVNVLFLIYACAAPSITKAEKLKS